MIFPKYLNAGNKIGVTAMSHSIDREPDRMRFRHGAESLEKKGYEVIFTDNVFRTADRYGRSSSGPLKATQFNALVKDNSIDAIFSASGGDFLAEMLPYVDIDTFRKNPKWVQGYSDNTSILYYLTTKADVATAYGANFGDFGMEPWDLSVERGLKVLEGSCRIQESFKTFQDGFGERITGFEGYSADGKVEWNILKNKNDVVLSNEPSSKDFIDANSSVTFSGRLIGGCMDVLMNISGTPFDGTKEFLGKYKNDGIIWYLESFDMHFEQMMEGLWKFRQMGWFDNAAGFIFGRPLFYPQTGFDGNPLPSYEEVLSERLGDLNVPIITGADIGHKGPQFIMINGALATVSVYDGKGKVEYI